MGLCSSLLSCIPQHSVTVRPSTSVAAMYRWGYESSSMEWITFSYQSHIILASTSHLDPHQISAHIDFLSKMSACLFTCTKWVLIRKFSSFKSYKREICETWIQPPQFHEWQFQIVHLRMLVILTVFFPKCTISLLKQCINS